MPAPKLNHREVLAQSLPALGLSLDDAQITALLDYLALIQKWTKVYNLTAVRDPDEMLTHHLLDSLVVIAPLQKQLAALVGQGVVGDKPRLLEMVIGAQGMGDAQFAHRAKRSAVRKTPILVRVRIKQIQCLVVAQRIHLQHLKNRITCNAPQQLAC